MGAHFFTRSKLLALSIFESEKTHILYCTHFNIVYDSKQKGVSVIVERTHCKEASFVLRTNNAGVKKKLHLKRRSYIFVAGINLHLSCRLWPQDLVCLTLQAMTKRIIKTSPLNSVSHLKNADVFTQYNNL